MCEFFLTRVRRTAYGVRRWFYAVLRTPYSVPLLVILLILFSTPSFAKKNNPISAAPGLPLTLGSTFLLLDTSMAGQINDVVGTVKSFGKKIENLSPEERDFLFGYASYRVGKYFEAEDFFKKCSCNSPVRDYVLFYLAKSAFNRGEYEKAEMLFKEILKDYEGSILTSKVNLGLGEVLIALKHFDEARLFLGTFIKKVEKSEDIFDARLLVAKSFVEEGNFSDAISNLETITLSVKDETELDKVVSLASHLPKKKEAVFMGWAYAPLTQYKIANSLMENSQWDDAIIHLNKALAVEPKLGELVSEAKQLNIRAHYRAHLYDEAVALIEETLGAADDDNNLKLLQQLAAAYTRLGNYERAIELRKKITDQCRQPAIVLDARINIALLLIDEGRYEEAIDAWKDVLRLKGGSRYLVRATWYIAWSHYQLGGYEDAIKYFDMLLKRGAWSEKSKDSIVYWKARSLEGLGEHNAARELFGSLVGNDAHDYYGVLAKRRLDGEWQLSSKIRKSKWRASAPPEVLSGKNHIAKAAFFNHIDLHEEAAAEISTMLAEKGTSYNDFLLWLASKNFAHDVAFRIVNQYYSSVLKTIPASDGFDRFVWEQSYPLAYKPVVEPMCGQVLDPKIVYAIMRAESNFRPKVISPAGAVGLMQLMPSTAKKMARDLGEKFETKYLYRPSRNIEYGVSYLKKLSKMFPGNLVAVIASYNAGEEAVGRWLAHGRQQDAEEFVEEIPYSETNLYVKKVLTSYWILEELYK